MTFKVNYIVQRTRFILYVKCNFHKYNTFTKQTCPFYGLLNPIYSIWTVTAELQALQGRIIYVPLYMPEKWHIDSTERAC